jgi:hypothetical protein
VSVTAEFEKMHAVLKTTLGSGSAADVAFQQINRFAKETPFQVKELTDGYVKLAQRGIEPTNEQLRRMGDFAAASGKPIGQLMEALLDINNTERWKEFGVRVSTSGDMVTASFAGMETQFVKTEAGALQMLETFASSEKVAGSMANISETLSGKLSNLEDSWDNLMFAIGTGTEGYLNPAIDTVITLTNKLTDLFKGGAQLGLEEYMSKISEVKQSLSTLTLDDLENVLEERRTAISDYRNELEAFEDDQKDFDDKSWLGKKLNGHEDFSEAITSRKARIALENTLIAAIEKRIKKIEDADEKEKIRRAKILGEIALFNSEIEAFYADAGDSVEAYQIVLDSLYNQQDMDKGLSDTLGFGDDAIAELEADLDNQLTILEDNFHDRLLTEEDYLARRLELLETFGNDKAAIFELENELDELRHQKILTRRQAEAETFYASMDLMVTFADFLGANTQQVNQVINQSIKGMEALAQIQDIQRTKNAALAVSEVNKGVAKVAGTGPGAFALAAPYLTLVASMFGIVKTLTKQGKRTGGSTKGDRVIMKDAEGYGVTGFAHENETWYDATKSEDYKPLHDVMLENSAGSASTAEKMYKAMAQMGYAPEDKQQPQPKKNAAGVPVGNVTANPTIGSIGTLEGVRYLKKIAAKEPVHVSVTADPYGVWKVVNNHQGKTLKRNAKNRIL